MQDQYRPAESILKTLTHDPETMRTRDLKPGEKAMSIWEEIQKVRNHMLNTKGKTREEQLAPEFPPSYFYGEADVLEDGVLLPEEFSTESSNALYSGWVNALENFGNEGPNWERFVHDLDTEEELSSDGSHESEESEESDDRLLEDGNDSDGEEWEDDSENEEYEHITEKRNLLENRDDTLAIRKSPNSEKENLLSLVFSKEQQKDLTVLEQWKPPRDFRADVKADFNTFHDREKSRRRFSLPIQYCQQQLIICSFQSSLSRSRLEPRRIRKVARSPDAHQANDAIQYDVRRHLQALPHPSVPRSPSRQAPSCNKGCS